MTAGCFEVHNDAVAIQAVIDANGTSATDIQLIPKFKDRCIVMVHVKRW